MPFFAGIDAPACCKVILAFRKRKSPKHLTPSIAHQSEATCLNELTPLPLVENCRSVTIVLSSIRFFPRPRPTRESIESYEQTPARQRTGCKFFHTDHGWPSLQEPHKCFKILGLEAVIFAESAVRLGSILALWLSIMINDVDRDRIRELCSLIAVEQDRQKLLQLIEELSLILAAKDEGPKVKQLCD